MRFYALFHIANLATRASSPTCHLVQNLEWEEIDMVPFSDTSVAFETDQASLNRRRAQVGLGPAVGLCLASVSSLMLWQGLASLARWAARTLF